MTKKTKLGMGIASSALALSLIAGGTYAYFSANAVNGDNELYSGFGKDYGLHCRSSVALKMVYFNNLASRGLLTQGILLLKMKVHLMPLCESMTKLR